MRHFDDIPISQIRKMPGYQTNYDVADGKNTAAEPGAFDENPSVNPTGGLSLEDEDAQARALDERVMHSKWNIRLAAYKEINNVFYSDYAEYEQTRNTEEYGPNGRTDLMASFD